MPPVKPATFDPNFTPSPERQRGQQLMAELKRLPGDGSTAHCEELIAKGVDTACRDSELNTPLILAAFRGYDGIAETLIFKKADVNAMNRQGHTALMLAASLGHLPVVNLLIKAGADLSLKDENGDTALDRAYSFSSNDVIHQRQLPIIAALGTAERLQAEARARQQMNAALEGGLPTKKPIKPLRKVQFKPG